MAEARSLDGRRARREQNIEAVVDAMLDLLGEGVVQPSAAQVAERSGVSLRSVFRYFDDLDSLLERAIARQLDRAAPLFDLLDPSGPTEARAQRLAAHRIRQHEALAPYARAALARSPHHPALQSGLAARRDALRRQLEALFTVELDGYPPDEREVVLGVMEAATSFDAVELLRVDRGLDDERTAVALVRVVVGLLGAERRA